MSIITSHVPDNWSQYALYPSSIPHLLHWDLAYLWILRKQPLYRPAVWNSRVETWRKLLFLFAAGRLKITTEKISPPLIEFTARYGIESIQRLSVVSNGETVTVGVTSPIVLVRPLPDFKGPLETYPADMSEVKSVLLLLISRLRSLVGTEGANRRLQTDLLKVLEAECSQIAGPEDLPHGLTSVAFASLRSIHFHQGGPGAEAATDSLHLQIADRTVSPGKKFVPRCHCREVLTQAPSDPPVPVRGDSVVLTCPAGHQTPIPISEFFIWRRQLGKHGAEYIAWRDRSGAFIAPKPDPMWPPEAESDPANDRVLRFTWNPGAALGAESKRTTVKLAFEDGAVRLEQLGSTLFYDNLLVPLGDLDNFHGLPVRWEWRDAFLGCERKDCRTNQVEFHGLSIAGFPFTFKKAYTVNLRPEANLSVGVYPRPMHDSWRAYRVAALGPSASNYKLRVDGVAILPVAIQTDGWPDWIAVESSDGTVGITYTSKSVPIPRAEIAVGSVRVGIDFGTTNTVVYFRGQSDSTLSTDRNAVWTSRLREHIYWLHGTPPPEFSLGWLLPSATENAVDPCLFPSALWTLASGRPILRWGDPPPSSAVSYGFKWDDGLQDRHADRLSYLREVLFWSLPYALHTLGNTRAKAAIDVGFSYPLAFEYSQRTKHSQLINELRDSLESQTGHAVNTFSVNESLAAVRALGAPNPGTHYLVADMGGRTLDVTLFQMPKADAANLESYISQIGSLDFGGELFLKKVSEERSGDSSGTKFERAYWDLRLNIQQGIAARIHHGDNRIAEVLDRLHTLAFEFLRTMVAAARSAPSGTGAPIRLLLIGNGWRLRDIRAAGQDPIRYFQDFSSSLTSRMGDNGLEAHSSDLVGVRSSKHLVAIGALKAAEDQRKELQDGQPYPSRLPAGRGITIQGEKYAWSQLVGQKGAEILPSTTARREALYFHFDDKPVATPIWQKQLDIIRMSPSYPNDDELREWIMKMLRDDRLLKGPLQLILEKPLEPQPMRARSCMAFLIANLAYAQPCTLPKLTGSRAVPGSQEGRFCAPATLPLRQGTAQVLFDDSGSMKGFQNHVSQLALWSEQSLSHVRQWGTSWTATRGCYFSSSRPLRSCTSRSLAANGFRGAADTTLQEAIESASAFDLTVIFTDGAAAAGSGSGDCAGGVDAACAARAMARALTPQPGQAQGATGGIWLVPLAAMFDGPFFTEQPMDPKSLDTARVQANVAADTATNALLGSPSRTSNGLLVYSYRGPRLLLVMVLARNAEVGRAVVASLNARMSFAQVQRLTALTQFQNGLAALRPIEVFPGAIPPVEFTRASVLEPTCQTLDAKLSSSSMLSVSCANEWIEELSAWKQGPRRNLPIVSTS